MKGAPRASAAPLFYDYKRLHDPAMADHFRPTSGDKKQYGVRRRAWDLGIAVIFLLYLAPLRAADEQFTIGEYRVLHNTVLSPRQIEAAVYPHLGPNKTLADVQAARTDLEKAYHDAGYSTVFVDIPQQSVENGVVRLQVTEGKVDRVRVLGTLYFSNRRILAAMPSL